MKIKMWLRKPVLVLLFLTVLAPIVLYTDKLSTFSAYEFVQEPSTVSLNRDVRTLNLLPQELSVAQEEPAADVYPENFTGSVHLPDGESSRKTRQLNEESKEFVTNVSSQEQEDNPIKQLTEGDNILESGDNKEHVNLKGVEHSILATQAETKPEAPKSSKAINEKPNERVFTDSRVRYLKDQLIRARVYLSLSATRTNAQFNRELRVRMKEVQRALGDATKDADLPKNAYDKLKAMDQTLAKGKQMQDDCTAVVKKLRAIIHSTEEQLRVHQKQALFLTHLTAKTVPKFPNPEKLDDPELFHYALFSDNVLATAVVVNSTVTNAKDPWKHVFHIVTDRLNYAAMRMWFLANPPGKATIQVENIDEFTWLNASYSPVLKQLASQNMIDYYFKTHKAVESDSNMKFRNPKYLSMMNHLRFYLPEIFPKLSKVVFLDDDIVVQKDLSGLWSIDLKGKVNGAVETCGENFHRFDRYLNFSNPIIAKNFDPRACGWAYGMNIFDLEEWKKQNITGVYHSWQNLNHERQLWKLGTLPPGLITFWNRVYPLDKSWHVLGLGYNPSVSQKEIERAAVIHYNGNMKPWLEIGIPKFRGYWNKFVDYDQAYMRDCNMSP
ncbi:hypothetical protein R6Q57_014435 [Mikania cordata]